MFVQTIALCVALLSRVFAEPQLIYVDDEYGDESNAQKPIYSTQTSGKIWNQGASCNGCSIKLNTSRIYNGTYHDITTGGSSLPSANFQVSFSGYTVDVYFGLAGDNLAKGVIVDATLDILIDNVLVGYFAHNGSQFSDYQYNQSIYSNSSMVNTNHTLTVRTAGTAQSVILFDYLTYTKDDDTYVQPTSTGGLAQISQTVSPDSDSDSSNSSSNKTNVAAIAGGVAGGVCALIALGGLILFFLRRKRREANDDEDRVDLISCFRGRRHSKQKASDLIYPFKTPTRSRPGSSTVFTSVLDPRRKSQPEPHGMIIPYSMHEPSDTLEPFKQSEEQTSSSRLLQDQVRYLLAEVARLRLRVQLPRGAYTSSGGTDTANSQPPAYATDVRKAPPATGNRQRERADSTFMQTAPMTKGSRQLPEIPRLELERIEEDPVHRTPKWQKQ